MMLSGKLGVSSVPRLAYTPRGSSDSIRYRAMWDGSFQPSCGCGIGVQIFKNNELIVSVSAPVSTDDATRCEALGPVLICLLLSRLGPGYVHVYGDSKYVCGLLDGQYKASDVQLYNCSEIVRDTLKFWKVRVTWIPRDQNSECDSLARLAVVQQAPQVTVAPSEAPFHARGWESIV